MRENAAFQRLYRQAKVLSAAIRERDEHTSVHCDRVALLVADLGIACSVPRRELSVLRISALFHDVGKIGVPDRVLHKPARLDEDEWKLMRAHSEQGERIFREATVPEADTVARIVRHHHENFDGSGYPDGLAGEDIPLLSRIISIVDSYDAMATSRPYQRARTHREIMDVLESEQGWRHDPDVFKAFTKCIEHHPARQQ